MLVAARKSFLTDALSEALGQIDPNITKKQILSYVPVDPQKILAAAGIRDEHVFPVPAVLERRPTLIGRYRLLLGVSQKRFYRQGTGMGAFKSMETRGLVSPRKRPDLEYFCTAMAENLAELVRQISPQITARDVSELPPSFMAATITPSAGRQHSMYFFPSERSSKGSSPVRILPKSSYTMHQSGRSSSP